MTCLAHGGCVGSVWIDENPLIDTARARPFIIAGLLFKGEVYLHDVVASISPYLNIEDLKESQWCPIEQDYLDVSRAEAVVLEVLGEMVAANYVHYNEESGAWELNNNSLTTCISWAASLGGRLPSKIIQNINYEESQRRSFTNESKVIPITQND